MAETFLGQGWQWPLQLDERRRIAMSRDEDAVHQAIQMILGTAPGERVMRPEFGCGIHDLVFAPNTPGTAGQVTHAVREALIQWEPRIDVLGVDTLPDETEPHLLRIVITYQVRTTNNRFNLVYPFYLES
jgi:phage baseplate assembly protein W